MKLPNRPLLRYLSAIAGVQLEVVETLSAVGVGHALIRDDPHPIPPVRGTNGGS
jgi:hypothetical protein